MSIQSGPKTVRFAEDEKPKRTSINPTVPYSQAPGMPILAAYDPSKARSTYCTSGNALAEACPYTAVAPAKRCTIF